MEELNDGVPRQISDVRPYSFKIGDTSGFGEYKGNGVVEQIKVPVKKTFVSLKHFFFFFLNAVLHCLFIYMTCKESHKYCIDLMIPLLMS